jgi:hypothetical protein
MSGRGRILWLRLRADNMRRPHGRAKSAAASVESLRLGMGEKRAGLPLYLQIVLKGFAPLGLLFLSAQHRSPPHTAERWILYHETGHRPTASVLASAAMLLRYRWKSRPDIAALEQELDRARSELVRLRSDLTNKVGYAATLELVIKQRAQTIDNLNNKIEQLRTTNQRLDAEAEHYFRMLAAG